MTSGSRFREVLRHAADPLLRNSLLLAINVVLGSVAGFLYWTFAARNYAPEAIGAAGAITSLLPLVATGASLGLAEMLIRHYSGEHDQFNMLRRSALTAVAVAALLATLWWWVAGSYSPLTEVADGARTYALLLTAVVASAAGLFTTATMIASRRPALILVETIVGATTRIVLLFVLQNHGAAGVLLSFTLGTVATTLTGGLLIATVLRPRRGTATKLARGQRQFALVNWASAIVSLTPRALAVTLIVWRAGTEAAAWVTIPLMTLPMLTIAPSVLGRSLFAEASHDPSQLPRMLRKTVLAACAITSIGMLVMLVLAPTFLGVFGAGYVKESSTLLRLLALAAVVAAPNYMLDVALNVSGHRSRFIVTNVTGTAALLVCLVLLSPFGPAGIGAAWVIGQTCYLLVAFTAWRTRSPRPVERIATSTTSSTGSVPVV